MPLGRAVEKDDLISKFSWPQCLLLLLLLLLLTNASEALPFLAGSHVCFEVNKTSPSVAQNDGFLPPVFAMFNRERL